LLTFDPAIIDRTFGTDYRIDGMLAGCLLALAFSAGATPLLRSVSRLALGPAITYLLFVVILLPRFGTPGNERQIWYYYIVGLPVVALATQIIIAYIYTHQQARLTRFLTCQPLRYTGRISYGMYLWHYPIILFIEGIGIDTPMALLPLALICTYVAAGTSFAYIENPLSRRFHKRFSSAENSLGSNDGADENAWSPDNMESSESDISEAAASSTPSSVRRQHLDLLDQKVPAGRLEHGDKSARLPPTAP
jgi:peptidoglycan/LPS O-acetylase OafA/YrhL